MDPAVRRGLGRDDRAQGDRARGRPARSDPGARRGGQRPDRAGALRVPYVAGGRRPDQIDRAGLHAPGRPRLPAPRPDLRRPARGQDHPPRDHRRGVRPQRPQLCKAMRVPRAAARARLGRRSPREHGYLVPGHRHGHAVRRGLAGAHVRVRDPPAGRRGGHDRHRPRDRHLPSGCGKAQCPVDRRNPARRHRVRQAHLSGRQDRGAGKGRATGRPSGRARFPHRRVPERRRDHAPADGAERRPRRRRAMGGRGRQRCGPARLHRGPGGSPDGLGLPGDRPAGGDLGAAAADRVRVPLCRGVPDGGAADADAGRGDDIPVICDGADLAPVLGAALRRAAPDQHGGSRGKDAGRGRDAERRYRHLAGRAGRDQGGRVGRRGDVGIPLHVGAVPGRRAGLRPLQGDGAGHVRPRGRAGRRLLGGARGHDRQSLARQHRVRHAPVRDPGGAPDPHLGPCRHRPLHRLRARRRRHDGDGGRHGGGRCRGRDQPDSGRRGQIVGIAGDLARAAGGPCPHPVAALVGRGGPGAQRRRDRRHRDDAALQPRRLDRRGVRARRHREREHAGPAARQPCREARRDRRHLEEPGGDPDRSGQRGRRLGLHRQGEGGRLRHVARPDHRVRRLEPHEGIRPPARRDRDLVAGLRGFAPLFDADRRQRAGGPRREPQRQPDPHAQLPGACVPGAPGVRELVGAGGAGPERCAGHRARARPALLRLAVRTAGHGRARHRRRRGHAHRLAADGGRLRAAPGIRRRLHRREIPRPRRTRSVERRRRGRIRGGDGEVAAGLCGRDRGGIRGLVGGRARPGRRPPVRPGRARRRRRRRRSGSRQRPR